jgi:hypothetical protein
VGSELTAVAGGAEGGVGGGDGRSMRGEPMPRVVPSDVVNAADRMFPDMARNPNAHPNMDASYLPSIAALARLVQAVPDRLIILDPRKYAALLGSIAALEMMGQAFQSARGTGTLQLRLRGSDDQNPIWIIRTAMSECPDEAPAAGTTALAFIDDASLRESIRLDVGAAENTLSEGEWKGTTVLAGSAVEALLLWALQRRKAISRRL